MLSPAMTSLTIGYKRKKFLQLLQSIDFKNKIVLEMRSGPGGNLEEVYRQNPKELQGWIF